MFVIIHYVMIELLKLMKAEPIFFTIAKLALLILLLFIIWSLISGQDYVWQLRPR